MYCRTCIGAYCTCTARPVQHYQGHSGGAEARILELSLSQGRSAYSSFRYTEEVLWHAYWSSPYLQVGQPTALSWTRRRCCGTRTGALPTSRLSAYIQHYQGHGGGAEARILELSLPPGRSAYSTIKDMEEVLRHAYWNSPYLQVGHPTALSGTQRRYWGMHTGALSTVPPGRSPLSGTRRRCWGMPHWSLLISKKVIDQIPSRTRIWVELCS